MHSEIQNGKKRNERASKDDKLTCDDRIGMFEAGLEELAICFTFDAMNVEGGVRLTISGLTRVNEPNGTWHFDAMKVESDNSSA